MGLLIGLLRPLVWTICRLFFRVRFYGVENIPAKGPCLITPNHVTYADPIWITIPVRRRLYYMAWDKPFQVPGLGLLMRMFGAFPVNQESADPSAQRSAVDLLRSGKALVVFPEGGRTDSGKMLPFRMGAFRLALSHGAPIVPVTIEGAYEIWPMSRLLPRPGRLTITYHPPIQVERAPESISKPEMRDCARRLALETEKAIAGALPQVEVA